MRSAGGGWTARRLTFWQSSLKVFSDMLEDSLAYVWCRVVQEIRTNHGAGIIEVLKTFDLSFR